MYPYSLSMVGKVPSIMECGRACVTSVAQGAAGARNPVRPAAPAGRRPPAQPGDASPAPPPSTEGKELVGADPSGHPDRMPPAVLADRVVRWFGGDGLNSSQRVLVTQVIHYVFGAGLGIGYTSAARRWPAVTSGGGGPAGLAIYLATHGTALPLLRIQEPPWRLPASAALWESTSHVVFGWTMEALRRAVTGQFGPR